MFLHLWNGFFVQIADDLSSGKTNKFVLLISYIFRKPTSVSLAVHVNRSYPQVKYSNDSFEVSIHSVIFSGRLSYIIVRVRSNGVKEVHLHSCRAVAKGGTEGGGPQKI